MSGPWTTFGDVANTASVAGSIASGARALAGGYQECWSSSNSLKQCWAEMEQIRVKLAGISPTRRRRIVRAVQNGAKIKTVEEIEDAFETLQSLHSDCCCGYADASFLDRYIPRSKLRKAISSLASETSTLLKDVWKTTSTSSNLGDGMSAAGVQGRNRQDPPLKLDMFAGRNSIKAASAVSVATYHTAAEGDISECPV